VGRILRRYLRREPYLNGTLTDGPRDLISRFHGSILCLVFMHLAPSRL
jgi:hypothetical protein